MGLRERIDKKKGTTTTTTPKKTQDLKLKSKGLSARIAERKLGGVPTQTAAQEPSLLGEFARGVAQPFARFGVSTANVLEGIVTLGAAGLTRLSGDKEGARRLIQEAGKLPTRQVDLPGLGRIRPVKGIGEPGAARDILGLGAELGSFGIGGGGTVQAGKQLLRGSLKQAVKSGVKAGAVGGGLGTGGFVAQDPEATAGDIAAGTALGVGLGAGLGAALPVAGAGVRTTAQFVGKGTKKAAEKVTPLLFGPKGKLRFISSVEKRLESFGAPGKKLVQDLKKVDINARQRAGEKLDALAEVNFGKLDDAQAFDLRKALEGLKPVQELDESVSKAFKVVDDIRREIGNEAQELRLKVKLKKGEVRPFFQRKNFFPRVVPDVDDLKKPKLRNEMIAGAIDDGFFTDSAIASKKNVIAKLEATDVLKKKLNRQLDDLFKFSESERAGKVLDDYVSFVENNGRGGDFWVNHLITTGQAKTREEARGMTLRFFQQSRTKKFGSLERARELDFPFFERDPRKVIPNYIIKSTKRLEEIGVFGQKNEELNKLVGKIGQKFKADIDVAKDFQKLTDIAFGKVTASQSRQKGSAFLRSLQVPKLAFSSIVNVGQSFVNPALYGDLPSTFRALFWTSKNFSQAMKEARKGGVLIDDLAHEIAEKAGASSPVARKFLKLVGFTATEKWNRVSSYIAGREYAKNLGKQITKSNSVTARRKLTELGLDADKIKLAKGIISEEDLATAGALFSDATQFTAQPAKMPAFASSPEGRVFFQFKNFAFNQSKLLKDELVSSIKEGNYKRAVRTLVVLGTVFPITGEVLGDIRAVVTRRERTTEALDRYLEDIAFAGGTGMFVDMVNSASYGKLLEALAGPTVSTGAGIVEKLVQGIEKGKLTDSDKRFFLNQLGFTRPLSEVLFPRK